MTVHRISRDADGQISLGVSLEGEREHTFAAWADPERLYASTDEPLFFTLSELSMRRYGDCARYHLEMCRLLCAVARGESIELPALLGATRFARPPTRLRWIANQIRRWLRA